MPLSQDRKGAEAEDRIQQIIDFAALIFQLPQETVEHISDFIPEITCYQLLMAVDIARNAIKNRHFEKIGKLSHNFQTTSLADINKGLDNIHNALINALESRFNIRRIRSGYGSSSFFDSSSALRVSGQWGFQSFSLFGSRLKGVSSFLKARGSFFLRGKNYSVSDIIHGPRKIAIVTKSQDGSKSVHIFGQSTERVGRSISHPKIEGTKGHRIIDVGNSEIVKVSFGYQHVIIQLDHEIIAIGWNVSQQLAFTHAVKNAEPRDDEGDLFVNERLPFSALGINKDEDELIHASACYSRSVFATSQRVFLAGDIRKDNAVPFKELNLPDFKDERILEVSHLRSGLILRTTGRIFAIGDCFNQGIAPLNCRELSLPDSAGKIIKVTSGHGHVVAWCHNGIYGCGANNENQINSSERAICSDFVLMHADDREIQDVLAVNDSTLAVCGGRLFACGKNYSYQLGLLEIENDYSCAVVKGVPSFQNVSFLLHRARYMQQLAILSDSREKVQEQEQEELVARSQEQNLEADADLRRLLIAKRLY